MCGLLGRILADPSVNTRPLSAAMSWLTRRGPDYQGLWASDDGRVELIHTRLHTVDPLPRSNQPFEDKSAGIVVAFNGDIYNFRELRQKYDDYEYRTESDTEVIISAYLKNGIDGFRDFRGAFSFVLVDLRAQHVLLVRDPIGTKPLMLARWGNQVLFASSILPMVAAFGDDVDIDEDSVQDFWELGNILPHRTVLRGATTVWPGQVLVFDFEGNQIAESDCRPTGGRVYEGESHEEVLSIVRSLLVQSIKRCTPEEHLPTVMLSGGIDSTLLSDMIVDSLEGSERKATAFTIGSVIPLTNDEPYARYAGWRLGMKLRVFHPHFGNLADEVAFAFEIQDEPLGMLSHFQLCTMLRYAKKFGRISISGDGADELFCGYSEVRRWSNADARGYVEHGRTVPSGPALPPWMGRWARHTATDSLIGHGFAKLDRAASEQALVIRVPFLDWDVMQFVRTLPADILLYGGKSKSILVNLLSDWPGWFVNRKKIGFTYNLRWIWLLSAFHGLRDMVNQAAIDRFADRLPPELNRPAAQWRTLDIHRHFMVVWKLASWSAFLRRLERAKQGVA